MTKVLSAKTIAEMTEARSFLRIYMPTADERAAAGLGPVVAELQASGELGAEHVHALLRWRADWMVYTADVSALTDLAAGRAARERLHAVRDRVGMVVEMRLIMLVVRHMTLDAIAATLYPTMPLAVAAARFRLLAVEMIGLMTSGSGSSAQAA